MKVQPWPSLPRSKAVDFALLERGESTLDELVAFLTKAGRDDPKPLVSAALAGLKKAGRAHSPAHGRWAPGAGRPGSARPAPAPERGAKKEYTYRCPKCSKIQVVYAKVISVTCGDCKQSDIKHRGLAGPSMELVLEGSA